MWSWVSLTLLMALAQRPVVNPARKARALAAAPQASGNFTLNVTPATISFAATNPGTVPVVAGSAAATASWTALGSGHTWSLTAQATSSTFTNCPTVPVSAVQVTCATVSVTGVGGSGSCAGSFPLSTSPQVVASGSEGLIALSYTTTVTFTLADSWKYIAQTSPACTISLTYVANVP